MNLVTWLFFIVVFTATTVYSWDVDERCLRRRQRGLRRLLRFGAKETDDSEQLKLHAPEEGFDHDESKENDNHSTDVPEDSFREDVDDWNQEQEKDREQQEERTDGGEDLHPRDDEVARELQGNYRFNLRMFWEVGYCWQEEWRERRWCMECEGNSCNSGDKLEIQRCENIAIQEFTWLPGSGNTGRLKVSNKDLCFERTSNVNKYRLRPCNNSDKQKLKGFHPCNPFELTPAGDSGRCFNQDHHPKAYEEIYTTSCSGARKDNTNRWIVEWPQGSYNGASCSSSGSGNPLTGRSPECSNSNPCPKCYGDCDNDGQCQGNLKCYDRDGATKDDPVPGCSGTGTTGWDYCYDDGSGSGSSSGGSGGTIPLKTPVIECTSNSKCRECEGDCDSNSHCQGNLICFQKTGNVPIPGCSGSDSSNTDWCVRPDA